MSDLATPQDVLAYWIAGASEDADQAGAQNQLWFQKSAATDAEIKARFGESLKALSQGLADDWAARGARERLAAIIVLDQFSRNIFRGEPGSFSQDALAHRLAQNGLATGEDMSLSEAERIFFYLPFEHAETLTDQDRSVALFEALVADARPAFKPLCESTLEYAHKHREVIVRFGRFPHRNAILGRDNTPAEIDYLSQPGAGF